MSDAPQGPGWWQASDSKWYPPEQMAGAAAPATAQTEPKATISLILGIVSIFCFGLLAGIPAIILGVMARKEIASSGGRLQGEGLALGGIITGGIGALLGTLWIALFVFGSLLVDSYTYGY